MKTFDALNKFDNHTYAGRIITFGLTEKENIHLKNYWSKANYEIYDTDIASDLIAISATAIIVNAKKLDIDDLELLEAYYTEVGNEADEVVFWLGSPKPAIELQLYFKCFDCFDNMLPVSNKLLTKK